MSTCSLVKVADIAKSEQLSCFSCFSSSNADLNDGMRSNILCTSSITTRLKTLCDFLRASNFPIVGRELVPLPVLPNKNSGVQKAN